MIEDRLRIYWTEYQREENEIKETWRGISNTVQHRRWKREIGRLEKTVGKQVRHRMMFRHL